MCGILGYINLKNKEIGRGTEQKFQESLKLLEKRGPNNTSYKKFKNILLGHTRLSIIDLNKRSNQPLENNKTWITFNGEIYNYKDLKKELIKKNKQIHFKTESDTEIILKLYENFPENQIYQKLDGMWAFAIYDIKKKKIILSRDRIGEKPLYYYKDEEKLIFSSEINPILNLLTKNEIKINKTSLANYNLLNFKHIPYPYTPIKDIYKLEPGYNLIYELKKNKLKKQKHFKIKKDTKITNIKQKKEINKLIGKFEKKFIKSLKNCAYAEVPVGVLLSGGIDSTLISYYLNKRDIKCYAIGYDSTDPEIKRAEYVAKKLNLPLKKIYFKKKIKKISILNYLKEIIKHYGEPINLFQIIYLDMIIKEMKKDGIKVILGGNGADELFYGYNGATTLYKLSILQNMLQKIKTEKLLNKIEKITPKRLKKKIQKLRYFINNSKELKITRYEEKLAAKTYIKKRYQKFIYHTQFREIGKELEKQKIKKSPTSQKKDNLLETFNWIGLRIENESSITILNDLISSKNSVELRTPFFSKEIIDFAISIRTNFKANFNINKNKYLLRKTLKQRFSKYISEQKKVGFGYYIDPILELYKESEKILKYLKYVPEINLYNNKQIYKIFNRFKNKKLKPKEYNDFLGILTTLIWYEQLIENYYRTDVNT